MFIEAILDNGRIATACKRLPSDAKKRTLQPSDFRRIGQQILATYRFISEKPVNGTSCRIVLRYGSQDEKFNDGRDAHFLDHKITVLGGF